MDRDQTRPRQIRTNLELYDIRFSSVLVARLVGLSHIESAELINELLDQFDLCTKRRKCENITSYSSCYVVGCGVTETSNELHAETICLLAHDFIDVLQSVKLSVTVTHTHTHMYRVQNKSLSSLQPLHTHTHTHIYISVGYIYRFHNCNGFIIVTVTHRGRHRRIACDLHICIGISSGIVVGGIEGYKSFLYDVWGDTVEDAYRLSHFSKRTRIYLTHETGKLINKEFITKKCNLSRAPLDDHLGFQKNIYM